MPQAVRGYRESKVRERALSCIEHTATWAQQRTGILPSRDIGYELTKERPYATGMICGAVALSGAWADLTQLFPHMVMPGFQTTMAGLTGAIGGLFIGSALERGTPDYQIQRNKVQSAINGSRTADPRSIEVAPYWTK